MAAIHRQWQHDSGTWNPTDPARFIQPDAFPNNRMLWRTRDPNDHNSYPGSTTAPMWNPFSYRFNGDGDSGAGGHSLGNLMLAALQMMEGDFRNAVEHASRILRVRGRVLPATLDPVTLSARFADGSRVAGESRIAAARRARSEHVPV